MKLIQKIFTEHASEYIRSHGDRMPEVCRKALEAVVSCRTSQSGVHIYECPDCGKTHLANSSCGNRHCPVCQNDKAVNWVYRQQCRALPCTYFLVTFTLPSELHSVAKRYPAKMYQAMFQASSSALKTLVADKRFVGCDMSGFFGILHTWGRQMQYHPHIHYVVAGGGLSEDRKKWVSARGDFLVHVRALSKMFRGKLQQELKKSGVVHLIANDAWSRNWVVHCKAVGSGDRTLKYLGAYVFRVAISDARILAYDGKTVSFKYRKVGSNTERRCTLTAMEFIRRYLMHILPKGFMKIRHYGFLHAKCSTLIAQIRQLIADACGRVMEFVQPEPPEKFKPILCQKCKTVMKWKRYISPWGLTYGSP
jgi:hypothetical protein